MALAAVAPLVEEKAQSKGLWRYCDEGRRGKKETMEPKESNGDEGKERPCEAAANWDKPKRKP